MASRFFFISVLLFAQAVQVFAQESPAPQVLNEQGISVEFKVSPLRSRATGIKAGEEATVNFKISGTAGGVPLSNLRPAVWIDQRAGKQTSESKECREKVQAFLQSSFSRRPTLDLNAYFILTLNKEPNISVLDPLGGFGGSKLYNLIPLPSPGEDWVMRSDQNRLYVSMPAVNQVAVIDLSTWKTAATIEAGVKPARVALQNDGRYLWVGTEGGVTVIDTSTLKVAAQLKTGAGAHEIAFTDDDRFAFVTNKQDGTLSVIDTRNVARRAGRRQAPLPDSPVSSKKKASSQEQLFSGQRQLFSRKEQLFSGQEQVRKAGLPPPSGDLVVKNIKIGASPVAIAFSSLSKAVYVASEEDGTITVVDAVRFEVLARMKAKPGLSSLRLQPEGRFGFALNPAENVAFVFDLTSNKIIHAVPVGPGADQLTFTKQFAYVRSSGSEFVNMIKLADLDKEAALSRFPAGQKAPKESATYSPANAIVPAPEEGAVIVANPADMMIYYYTEGMAAPMGSFQNYRRVPKALLVFDNGLRETARGVYSTTIRLDTPGFYDAVFLLDSPRAVHCFGFRVEDNPAKTTPARPSLTVQQLTSESPVVGESYNLRFKLIDQASGKGQPNLDMFVLVFLTPGIWQERIPARHVRDGVYEINFVPPKPGVYYVHFRIPSLDVQLGQIFPLVLDAKNK